MQTFMLIKCTWKILILSLHASTFTHPSMQTPILQLDSDWFFLNNLFSLPCLLWRHLTQRPCLFYYKGESNHVSAENERLIFTLSSVVDVVELNQRLPPSIYLSSPSTNTQVVIALLCYTVVVSISALASLRVRFHISTQFSVSNSKWDFKRILI